MADIKVFVSSTAKDLKSHRNAVIAAIRACDGWHPVVMEDFNASEQGAQAYDAAKLAPCQVYVGLIGLFYGTPAPGDGRSFTELEYEDAGSAKIDRLCFLAPDDLPVPGNLREDDDRNRRQQAFRNRIGLRHVAPEFSDPGALAAKVVTALREWERKPSSPPSIGPSQLPADIEDFVGREDIIRALMQRLDRDGGGVAAVSALGGMGGIGKTRLAVRVAHRLKGRYPDAQLWVDMLGQSETPLTPAAALMQVVRAFHPSEPDHPDPAALAARTRAVLAGRRVLIVLDNARDTAQVTGLTPPAGCGLIVTARERIRFDGVAPLMLELLPEADAVALLHAILADRSGIDDDALAEIARFAGHLPLALRVAGEFLRDHPEVPLDRYLKELETDRLAALAAPDQPDRDVPVVLRHSARRLAAEHPALAERWQTLSVFPADFDAEAAAAVWQSGDGDTVRTLSRLTDRALVLVDADTGRYRLHDLMRPIAATTFAATPDPAPGTPARLHAAAERHARHFWGVLRAADALYEEGHEDAFAGLALYDREDANIRAAAAWARSHAATDTAANEIAAWLPNDGAKVLGLRWPARDRIGLREDAGAASRRLENRALEGWHLSGLGLAYRKAGEPQRAIEAHERHLTICRDLGDRKGEGQALGNLGVAHRALGDIDRAISYYELCLPITRDANDRHGEGSVLGNLGIAHRRRGDGDTAIEYHRQHIDIAAELGDHEGKALAHFNMALSLRALGRRVEAVDAMERARDLFEALRHPKAPKARSILAKWRAAPP